MLKHKLTAYEGQENYIFVSYAHKDAEKVFPIMKQLHDRGYRIWYDEGIAPGSEWPEDIARHLNGSAMVIAFVTANSMGSVNCRREINFALSKEKPFLSVVLEPTEMPLGMELQLSAQQSVLRHNYNSEEKFVEKICACPGMAVCQAEQRDTFVAAPRDEKKPGEKKQQKKSKLPVIVGAVVLLVAVILGVAFASSGEKTETAAPQNITVHAQMPAAWGSPYCWAWSAKGDVFDAWPGGAMTWKDGWYTIEVPHWTSGILINADTVQTNDIPVEEGVDVWVVVRGKQCHYFYEEPTEDQLASSFDTVS